VSHYFRMSSLEMKTRRGRTVGAQTHTHTS
jgi:hypothetical protein